MGFRIVQKLRIAQENLIRDDEKLGFMNDFKKYLAIPIFLFVETSKIKLLFELYALP